MSKKLLAFILLLFSLITMVKAQNTGDYQSPGTGVTVDLGSLNNWQIYNGSVWISAASVTPTPAIPSGAVSGTNITIQSPDVWANSIAAATIPSGVTLTVNSAATLGTFTAAKLTCLGTLVYSGTAAQTMPAATAFVSSQINNLTIDNAAGVAIPTAYTIKGVIDLKAGTLTPAAGGALSYGGSIQTEGGLLSLTPSNVVLYIVGSAGQIIPGNAIVNSPTTGIYKLNSLTQGGTANYSSTGPITVTSALYLNTGTFTLGGPLDIRGGTMAFATGVVSPGSIVAGSNQVTFNASSAQTVPANFFSGNTISNLNVKTISSTQGGTIFAGPLTINSSLTVASYLIPAAPSAAVNLTGTGANGVLNITGSSLAITAFSGTPVAGTPYAILSAPTITGTFSGLTLPIGYTGTLAYNTTVSPQTVTLTVTPSSDATLSALSLSAGALTPAFASATTSYTATVSNTVSTITITPTATISVSNIKVNGTTVASGTASTAIPLSVGSNTITAVVTAQDGVTSKTYTFNVTRAAISTDATLSALSLSTGTLTPVFAGGTTSYTASVGYTANSITITPTTNDPGATLTVNGTALTSGSASAAIPLNVGSNTITTLVTAQDGTTTQTYTVNITRTAASTDATLSALSLSTGTLTPVFASGTTNYTASVANAANTITVTPTVNNAAATLTVNGTAVSSGSASAAIALNVGNNTIIIATTAQDGVTTKTYTINVTRAALSTDATLSALSLSTGTLTPVFATGTTSYAASVINATSSITITPTTNDPTATLTVNGTTATSGSASPAVALAVGSNVIAVIVTAQDGLTTKTYTVNVTRAALSTDATLSALALSAGALSPVFSSNIIAYSVAVTNAASTIMVTPTANDANATVAVNGTAVTSGSASAAIPLSVGSNTITIAVTSQHGTVNTYTLTVTRPGASQTITFNALTGVTYGAADFAPGASSTNNTIPIIYSSSNTAVATITNTGNIHIVGAGSAAITASQAGNNVYNPATSVSQTLVVTPAILTVTANNQTKVYGAALPTLTVSYSGFVNGDTQSILTTQANASTTATATSTVNTYPITAGGAATGNNYIINYVPGTLTVTPATRVFAFGTLPAHTYGDLDFTPTATVNTGETITYTSSDATVATIVNGLMHIVSGGTVTITASIAANPNYVNVAPISQVYTINRATQTITFGAVTILQVGRPAFVTNASSSSGLPVTLTSADQSIASISGLNINAVSLGSTTVTATQAGNSNYLPASLSQAVQVQDEAELVKVHTGVSPNGDGINDYLIIDGILDYQSNTLVIVNRNGSKIFQASGYDNVHHVFDGHSSVNGDMVPAGTYYYELTIQTKGENKRKAGYIILKFN